MRVNNGEMGNIRKIKEGFPKEQMVDLRADGKRFTRQRDRMGQKAFRSEATACAKALWWENHSVPERMKGQHGEGGGTCYEMKMET